MRFWWFFFSSTFRELLKLSSKPKSEASICPGSEGIRKIKWTEWNYHSRKICNYQYTLCTWLSLTCWQAVDDIQGRCTGRFGLVDSRAHRVSSLICSLRRDGDWTSQGYWRKWLHCFWFHKFGFNWENQNGRKTHFLSLTSLRGTAINKEAPTQNRNVTIKWIITWEVACLTRSRSQLVPHSTTVLIFHINQLGLKWNINSYKCSISNLSSKVCAWISAECKDK